jgi:hypothetical protein
MGDPEVRRMAVMTMPAARVQHTFLSILPVSG